MVEAASQFLVDLLPDGGRSQDMEVVVLLLDLLHVVQMTDDRSRVCLVGDNLISSPYPPIQLDQLHQVPGLSICRLLEIGVEKLHSTGL